MSGMRTSTHSCYEVVFGSSKDSGSGSGAELGWDGGGAGSPCLRTEGTSEEFPRALPGT